MAHYSTQFLVSSHAFAPTPTPVAVMSNNVPIANDAFSAAPPAALVAPMPNEETPPVTVHILSHAGCLFKLSLSLTAC